MIRSAIRPMVRPAVRPAIGWSFGSGQDPRAAVIAALFGGGEQGLYCWARPDGAYQTSGQTGDAAEDQPIGFTPDGSPNGNNLDQPASSARPLLRQTAIGLWYWEFDGSDDALQILGSFADIASGNNSFSLFAALESSSETYNSIASFNQQAEIGNRVQIREQNGAYRSQRTETGFANQNDQFASLVTGAPVIVGITYDGSTTRGYINGELKATLSQDLTAVTLDRFLLADGSSGNWSGRIYSSLAREGQLTGDDLALAHQALAADSGATLA